MNLGSEYNILVMRCSTALGRSISHNYRFISYTSTEHQLFQTRLANALNWSVCLSTALRRTYLSAVATIQTRF